VSARRRRSDIDRAAVFEAILGDLGSGEPESPATPAQIAIDSIRYNEQQPRHHIDPTALAQLTASVRQRGVLEPILVRRVEDGFELVAGERRTRAAQDAGLRQVPAIVLELDDREALEISIIENLQREDLNAVEETEAVLALLGLTLDLDRAGVLALLHDLYQQERGRSSDDRFDDAQRSAAAELFERLGRFTPMSFLVNRVPILSFPGPLLEAVRTGRLAFTKAQAIARVEPTEARDALLREALDEDLSLSQIRRRITEIRSDEVSDRPVGERVVLALNATRRLLSRRRVASLSDDQRQRLAELLEDVQRLLEQ
jgi:ParB family transcriptional regulator, chromosome partitioning protein